MMKIKSLLICAGISLLTTHCAAQGVPANTPAGSPAVNAAPSAGSEADLIAGEIPNPCAEKELAAYKTLKDINAAGRTCHEASILTADIAFFLTQKLDRPMIVQMVKDEAKSMASPKSFDLEGRPRLGSASAPVEVVIFSDFQCPFCARAAKTVHSAYQARSESVSFVFKQLPLTSIHAFAAAASLISIFAESKGRFWEIHDKFYASQKEMGPDFLTETLASLGAKPEDIFDPIKGQPYGVIVVEDVQEAEKAGVQGTPTFFVNGVMIEGGANHNRLVARIDAELAAPPAVRERVLKRNDLGACPYPGVEKSYAELSSDGKAQLALMTDAVFCPCIGSNSSLHVCASDNSCPQAVPIIETVITRIQNDAPREAVLAELEAAVAEARNSKR